MNEQNANDVRRLEPSDEQILAGLRTRMTGVEPLLPPAPEWRSEQRGGAAVRPLVRLRAPGLPGLALVAAAVVIVALAVGPLGLRNGPAVNPTASAPTATATEPAAVKLSYAVDPVGGRLPTKAEETHLSDLIAARLQAIGIGNFTIAIGTSIQLDLPASVDLASVRYVLNHPGVFEIVSLPPEQYGRVEASSNVTAGPKPLPAPGDAIDPALPVLVPDQDFLRDQFKADSSTGTWTVAFALNADGTGKMATFSTAHVGDYIAIVLDGKVVSAPYIVQPITDGNGEIPGGATSTENMLLAAVLRNGPLAFPIHELSASGASPAPSGAGSAGAGHRWHQVDVGNVDFHEIYGWSGGYVATALSPDGQNTLEIYSSPDGNAWDQGSTPYPLQMPSSSLALRVIAGPAGLALIDIPKAGPVVIWTSADGVTWIPARDASAFGNATVTAVLGDSSGYVAIGGDTAGSGSAPKTVWTSPDGSVWQAHSLRTDAFGTGASVRQLARVPGGYVASGRIGGEATLWFSTDLDSWSQSNLPNIADRSGVQLFLFAAGPNSVVAEALPLTANGSGRSQTWASSSGRAWIEIADPRYFELADGSRAVAFGTSVSGGVASSAVWTSTDGVNWTQLEISGASRPDWGDSGPGQSALIQAALRPNGDIAVYWQTKIWLLTTP